MSSAKAFIISGVRTFTDSLAMSSDVRKKQEHKKIQIQTKILIIKQYGKDKDSDERDWIAKG